MTLPLKAAAFERYMLSDDRASHPMSFTIRLQFEGEIDPILFTQAANRAVLRHPLLCANLVSHGRQLTWVAAHDAAPYVDYGDEAKPIRFPGAEQIDLTEHTGLRIWVRSGRETVEMRFQFHHCCTDGIGAYRVIEDILCAYHKLCCPHDAQGEFRPIEPVLLRGRGKFCQSWWRALLRFPIELWGIIVGLGMFLFLRPQRLLSPATPPAEPADSPTLIDMPAHTFTVAESNRLRDVARAAGATMNDLLLRDQFLAMRAWNERQDPTCGGRLMRIMMPVNLRGPNEQALPATNRVAMVNIDRWLKLYPNPAALLSTIRWETWFLQRFRFGVAFIRCISLVELIPGGMRFMAATNRCYATSVLSNMGRVLSQAPLPRTDEKVVAGGLTLVGIESAPPVRPFVATALTCLYYRGQLTLVQNYDRHHFTPEAAQELLDVTVQQILTSAGVVEERPMPTPKPTIAIPSLTADTIRVEHVAPGI